MRFLFQLIVNITLSLFSEERLLKSYTHSSVKPGFGENALLFRSFIPVPLRYLKIYKKGNLDKGKFSESAIILTKRNQSTRKCTENELRYVIGK